MKKCPVMCNQVKKGAKMLNNVQLATRKCIKAKRQRHKDAKTCNNGIKV